MRYSGEFYCQYANSYVKCKNLKCSKCLHYQKTFLKTNDITLEIKK